MATIPSPRRRGRSLNVRAIHNKQEHKMKTETQINQTKDASLPDHPTAYPKKDTGSADQPVQGTMPSISNAGDDGKDRQTGDMSSSPTSPVMVQTGAEPDGTQNGGGPDHPWVPLNLEEAQDMWERLEFAAKKPISDDVEEYWIIGEHGGCPLLVVLLKGQKITAASIEGTGLEWAKLPRVRFMTGSLSIQAALRKQIRQFEWQMTVPARLRGELSAIMRSFFLENAIRPIPDAKPIPTYEPTKPTLTLRAAEKLAAEGFKIAQRVARPKNADGFANDWAAAALEYVTGSPADEKILTPEGMAILDKIRSRNVHKTTDDLLARRLEINGRLADESMHLMQDKKRLLTVSNNALSQAGEHVIARFASFDKYQNAVNATTGRNTTNHKPFSQRFIKGMVLAKVSGAKLCIGPLTDAISENLGAHYGSTLLDMQEAKVFLNPGKIPEMWSYASKDYGVGYFLLADSSGNLLDAPHIYLTADLMMLDHRSVYHEFQHARQYLACEKPLWFYEKRTYESAPTEIEAKLAEAGMMAKFGILF